jgi:hypothetical protein
MDSENIRNVWSGPRKVMGFFTVEIEKADHLGVLDTTERKNRSR